jgi:hypothetical protein
MRRSFCRKCASLTALSVVVAVGSLMYVMVAMRPDIAHAVGVVSRFMHNPGRPHWNVVKHIFRYLVGTQDYGIKLRPNEPLGPVGYTDSDYAGCLETTRLYSYKHDRSGVHSCVRRSEGSALARTTSSYVSTM